MQETAPIGLDGPRLCAGRGVGHVGKRLLVDHSRRPAHAPPSQVIDRSVAGHPKQPRQEFVAGRPLGPRFVQPHQDLLSEVTGVFAVAGVAVRQGEHPPLNLTDEHLPGEGITCPAAVDERRQIGRIHLYCGNARGAREVPSRRRGSCPGRFRLSSRDLRLSSLRANGKRPGHPRRRP